jgi:hypothetical protein
VIFFHNAAKNIPDFKKHNGCQVLVDCLRGHLDSQDVQVKGMGSCSQCAKDGLISQRLCRLFFFTANLFLLFFYSVVECCSVFGKVGLIPVSVESFRKHLDSEDVCQQILWVWNSLSSICERHPTFAA